MSFDRGLGSQLALFQSKPRNRDLRSWSLLI